MNKANARAAIDRIEKLIEYFGYPNAQALSEIKNLLLALARSRFLDAYFREKIGSAGIWAEIGFSVRKFKKYPGGVDQVKGWALNDISSARSQIERNWPNE